MPAGGMHAGKEHPHPQPFTFVHSATPWLDSRV